MDEISQRRKARSLSILARYLEEEGKDAAFSIVGMLTRQIRIISQAREFINNRVPRPGEMAKRLGVPSFVVGKVLDQARRWREERPGKGAEAPLPGGRAPENGISGNPGSRKFPIVYLDSFSESLLTWSVSLETFLAA